MKKIPKLLYVLAALALLYWAWLLLLLFLSYAPWSKPFIWMLMLAFPAVLGVAHWRRSPAIMAAGLLEFVFTAAIFQTL
jgi:hypothetical protein